jgi:hypothetical protein
MLGLNQFGRLLRSRVKWLRSLVHPMTEAARGFRRRRMYEKMETERLDRIRNPSKYRLK